MIIFDWKLFSRPRRPEHWSGLLWSGWGGTQSAQIWMWILQFDDCCRCSCWSIASHHQLLTVYCSNSQMSPPPYMIEIQTQETKEFELKKNTPFVYYLTYVYVVLPKNSMDILNYTSLYFTKLKENEWLICIYSWKSKHPIIQTLSIPKQTSGVWSFLLVLTIHCLFLRRIFDFLLIFTTFFYFFHSCTESSNISKKTFYLGAWMVVNELVNEY